MLGSGIRGTENKHSVTAQLRGMKMKEGVFYSYSSVLLLYSSSSLPRYPSCLQLHKAFR